MVRICNEIKNLKEITKSLNPIGYLLDQQNNSREINIDEDSSGDDDELPPIMKLRKSLMMGKAKPKSHA